MSTPQGQEGSAPPSELVHFAASKIQGLGGFATKSLPEGTRVLEYVGQKIDKAESRRRCEANNVFIFALDDTTDLDGAVGWNPARFVNHSCAPNCDAILDEGRIWLVASRDITAGEELTFNYGFGLEDYREYPCHCGSANCVGYIVAEEFFEHVRRQRELETAADGRAAFPGCR